MNVTLADALSVVSLETVKQELRIPPFAVPADPAAQAAAAATQKEHDDFLIGQITAAVSFVSRSTGLELADLPRPAIISAVRDMYNGVQRIGPNAAAYGWLTPYRSYAPE